MSVIKEITASWWQPRLYKWTGNIQVDQSISLPFFHLSLCYVIELQDLAGPSLSVHWGGGWAVSLNPCLREVYTKDGNKVSRQHICATIQSSSFLCVVSSSICTGANHHCVSHLILFVFFYLLLGLARIMYLIVYEICLNRKFGNRIMRIFPTASTCTQHCSHLALFHSYFYYACIP